MEAKQMFFAYALGAVMLAGYLALGVWAIRKTAGWVTPLRPLVRALLISLLVTVLFAPGIAGGGHGVAVAPAWLMFATGTFGALTATSKMIYLLGLLLFWLATCAVTWVVVSRQERS